MPGRHIHQFRPTFEISTTEDKENLRKQYTVNDSDLVYAQKNGKTHSIASGNFGIVYKGSYKGEEVAIKEIKVDELLNNGTTEDEIQKEFNIEVDLMLNLRDSPSIMGLKGLYSNGDDYKMVMELMTGGSLVNYLSSDYHKTTGEKKWLLIMDIVYGILCLHAKDIVHRDIKPHNILIKNGRAKISDFGISRQNIKTKH